MDYLNHHGREKEKLERLQLVALKFKMFRELAKVKEQQAMKDLKKIKPKSLGKDGIFPLPPQHIYMVEDEGGRVGGHRNVIM